MEQNVPTNGENSILTIVLMSYEKYGTLSMHLNFGHDNLHFANGIGSHDKVVNSIPKKRP